MTIATSNNKFSGHFGFLSLISLTSFATRMDLGMARFARNQQREAVIAEAIYYPMRHVDTLE